MHTSCALELALFNVCLFLFIFNIYIYIYILFYFNKEEHFTEKEDYGTMKKLIKGTIVKKKKKKKTKQSNKGLEEITPLHRVQNLGQFVSTSTMLIMIPILSSIFC